MRYLKYIGTGLLEIASKIKRKILILQNNSLICRVYESVAVMANLEPRRQLIVSSKYNDIRIMMAKARNEAHRLEKAACNGFISSEECNNRYDNVASRLRLLCDAIYKLDIKKRENPIMLWTENILKQYKAHEFQSLSDKSEYAIYNPTKGIESLQAMSNRSSTRSWASRQPSKSTLEDAGRMMINAAREAPSSGNRQPWRFLIINNCEDGSLLASIKEPHCMAAPACIFVGMQSGFYGDLPGDANCIYLDAGAAIMSMLLIAHSSGLGACWNHLTPEFIESRDRSRTLYKQFQEKYRICKDVHPIAIISYGLPAYKPAKPARMPLDDLLLSDHSKV